MTDDNIVFFLAIVFFGALSGVMAKFRNRNVGTWFILGCLFGIFPAIGLLIIGNAPPEEAPRVAPAAPAPVATVATEQQQ